MRTPFDLLDDGTRHALAALPRSLRLLLENALPRESGAEAARARIAAAFTAWLSREDGGAIPFRPTRILMQDTAGVAALVDLAALRDFVADSGGDAATIDPQVPIDLVIDHSVKVDFSGTPDAATRNVELEFARNRERYGFFKWAENAFAALRVVPPGNGICHQINLERLAAIARPAEDGSGLAVPETVIGTDSHTTMINALGILGWGVGGMEAELAALGEPVLVSIPDVTCVLLDGAPRPAVTATDIALSVTAFLRETGVVNEIVEFHGEGASALSLPDRAAISNMCPEYGATAGLFAVDAETLRYLRAAGRGEADLALQEEYARATGLWAGDDRPRRYRRTLRFDLSRVEPVMAGPARPQDIIPLAGLPATLPAGGAANGAIVIAAITSCTNTANPILMLEAGLVARRATERGLRPPPWVKASLAPGSRSMAALLHRAGLMPALEETGFALVGFGCTTCVGNSGALTAAATQLLAEQPETIAATVLSGNRNFPNRIHAQARANYLASPPLVVAAALAGTMARNLASEPLGTGRNGEPVFLADIWPAPGEAAALLAALEDGESGDFPNAADALWEELPAPSGETFPWRPESLLIRRPSFFHAPLPPPAGDIGPAAVLLWLPDSVTTDHISPIGAIDPASPAAAYLRAGGWRQPGYGSYGDYRGNDEVMLRGTFDNRRLLNRLAGREGNFAIDGEGRETSVFDAAQSWSAASLPLVLWAGRHYGCGSARDWAAKGTALLGVRAVIAESFERIHRSNLLAMGVLPVRLLEPLPLALTPATRVTIRGLHQLRPHLRLTIEISGPGFCRLPAVADIDTQWAADIYRRGGVFASLAGRFASP